MLFGSGLNAIFKDNKAVHGGTICALSTLDYLYNRRFCFLSSTTNFSLTFISNKAMSGIGHDIFVSSLQPCLRKTDIVSYFKTHNRFNFCLHQLEIR